MRRNITSGSTFEAEIGYSRAVVDGEWAFVSGTTGFDYTTMSIADDVVDQARQALFNIMRETFGDIRPAAPMLRQAWRTPA